MPNNKQLTWGLVIATYKREQILLRCLHLATQQTLPPQEIIVVDASPNWENIHYRVMHEVASHYSTIDWKYVQANRASLPAQRNQGIALATTDILFLIDDDSLMYPDCAAEVMRIYAQDTEHQVVGVLCSLAAKEPAQPNPQSDQSPDVNKLNKRIIVNKLRNLVSRRLLKDTTSFVPYDSAYSQYTLPASLDGIAQRIFVMEGARMTFRRELFQHISFEEVLERYAICEDADVGYRAARLGILLRAFQAQICHLYASGGRLSRKQVMALWVLNQIVLHRFYSSDLVWSKQQLLRMFLRRLTLLSIKDILAFRWLLPSAQGILFGLRYRNKILAMEVEQLRSWYPQFQQELISGTQLL